MVVLVILTRLIYVLLTEHLTFLPLPPSSPFSGTLSPGFCHLRAIYRHHLDHRVGRALKLIIRSCYDCMVIEYTRELRQQEQAFSLFIPEAIGEGKGGYCEVQHDACIYFICRVRSMPKRRETSRPP